MAENDQQGRGRISRFLGEGGASSAVVFTGLQVGIQSVALFLTYRLSVLHVGLAALGLWSVASAAATFGRVGDLGFGGAVPRLLAGRLGTNPADPIAALVETAVLSTAIGTLILAAIFFLPLLLFTRHLATAEQAELAFHFVLGANAVLFLSAISATLQACLDGLGKFRQRASISISGVLLNLVILWLLIDRIGPTSLAVAALAQGMWSAVMAWLLLRQYLNGLSLLPWRWSQTEFRALFAVGKFMQANSLLLMLFDPLSRVLAGQFGSVEFAALFDLAAKVTGNVRLLFSSFTQALIPFYAFTRSDPARTAVLFGASTALIAVVASSLSALAMGFSPLLSMFALGKLDYRFLSIFWVLLLGNLINVIGGPSYSYTIGAGSIGFSTRSLALQAFVFIAVAALLHAFAVDLSVAIAYALAVAVTGTYLFVYGLRVLPIEHDVLVRVILLATAPVAVVLVALLILSTNTAILGAAITPFFLMAVCLLLTGDIVLRYRYRTKRWAVEIMDFRIAPSRNLAS